MVRLTFYGGVNEVAGNRILLEDKRTRIFLDFGLFLTFGSEFFTCWFQSGCLHDLGGYFEFNLSSKINDIYLKEMHLSTNSVYIEPKIDTVFLSHTKKACFDGRKKRCKPSKKENLHRFFSMKPRES